MLTKWIFCSRKQVGKIKKKKKQNRKSLKRLESSKGTPRPRDNYSCLKFPVVLDRNRRPGATGRSRVIPSESQKLPLSRDKETQFPTLDISHLLHTLSSPSSASCLLPPLFLPSLAPNHPPRTPLLPSHAWRITSLTFPAKTSTSQKRSGLFGAELIQARCL